MRRSLARGLGCPQLQRLLVVAALACFGLLFFAAVAAAEGSTLVGTNSSEDSESVTGDVTGASSLDFNGGPAAEADQASAQQLGRNTARAAQSGKAKTGDAVAGSAVTGSVSGNTTIQHSNFAVDPSAETGEADIENEAELTLGPLAEASQAQQFGDNDLELAQETEASSGDAVAGSQVAGIVGDGEHTVQMQNAAECGGDCALSGDAVTSNDVEAAAGPAAEDDVAQVGQIGDNDAVLEQSSATKSGDGLSGAQVTGVVGGSATVQNSNFSVCDGDCAESGVAGEEGAVTNAAVIQSGPAAESDTSQVSQSGDNRLDATQTADAVSGDAVSGSQVTGLVSEEEGHLTVQNQQASEGDEAITGQALDANELEADAGPDAEGTDVAHASQNGDNAVTIDQTSGALTGDAVAGSQVTGAVAGDRSQVTVQNQNSAGTADAAGWSGSAVAASQVTGVVTGDNSTTTIGLSNNATGDEDTVAFADFSLATNAVEATSGPGTEADDVAQSSQFGDNTLSAKQTGNDGATAELVAGPSAEADIATVGQTGDDAVTAAQENVSASGDAVAGSQVTGSVSGEGSEATVQAQNAAIDSVATSGIDEGPVIVIPNTMEVAAGPLAEGDDVAQASQSGDATADLSQSADASSGDAVSGSQVTGVVGPEDATVQVSNFSDGDEAESGDVDATNDVTGTAGPSAIDGDVSTVSHSGDTDHSLDQELQSTAGDAVSGAQVSGDVGQAA